MSQWQSTSITPVNISSPNDGLGTDIRDSFGYVNANFENISLYLGGDRLTFISASVEQNLDTNYANIDNLFVANATGIDSNFTGNLASDTITANTQLTSIGITTLNELHVTSDSYFAGNINMSANIIPDVSATYDLGSPSNPFRNLYVQTTVSTTQINASSDSGMLLIHANANPGDSRDVGIFGNVSSDYNNSVEFAFFGHQFSTGDFVYEVTPTDAFNGTQIITDGTYGNAHFGSLFLSNTDPTFGNALIVDGTSNLNNDVYISGNIYSTGNTTLNSATIGNVAITGSVLGSLNVTGAIYVSGSPLLTVSQLNTYTNLFPGGQFYGNVVVANVGNTTYNLTVSGTNTVGGNVIAGGLVGPLYGVVQTAEQPNITTVGSLGNLTVVNTTQTSSLQATQIGVNTITATTLNVTGSLLGLSALGVTGPVTATSLSAATVGNVGATVIGTNGFIGTINASTVNATNIGNVGATLTGTTINATTAGISTLRSNTINAVTIGNVGASLIGSGSGISGLTGANVVGTVGTAGISMSTNVLPTTNNSTFYPGLTAGATGNSQVYSSSNLTFNPSTGNLSATGFIGTYYGTYNGNYYGTIQTGAQPNITSVGQLTGLTVNGNTIINSTIYGQFGVYDGGGRVISASSGAGNLYLSGNTITLTDIGTGSATIGSATTVPTVVTDQFGRVVSLTANTISTKFGVAGTTGSSPIASSGITNGVLTFAGANGVTAAVTTGNATSATVTIGTPQDLQTTASPSFVGMSGTLNTAAQPNITSVGILSSLNINGSIQRRSASTGYLDGFLGTAELSSTTGPIYVLGGTSGYPTSTSLSTMYGIGYAYTGTNNFSIPSLTGAPTNSWGMYVASGGNPRIFLNSDNGGIYVSGGFYGAVKTASQTSITAVGTLSGLSVSADILPNQTGTINIGSTGLRFNRLWGTSTSAVYSDLAENYVADHDYEPGTVVIFGGSAEITVTTDHGDERVAGAISTNPAYLMNDGVKGLPVALRGRIPVKVIGPVTKGDSLVTSTTSGHAVSIGRDRSYGQAVFAKALETNLSSGEKIIEAVIL